MEKSLIAALFIVIFGLLGTVIGYDIVYRENYSESYEIGYQDGINYQAKVDMSNIVLGLLYIPSSGYYIINQNYGNFKVNATSQVEAIKYLQREISPCL
jgi:regulatory protein YycI of two-component signal transduction system YycFG